MAMLPSLVIMLVALALSPTSSVRPLASTKKALKESSEHDNSTLDKPSCCRGVPNDGFYCRATKAFLSKNSHMTRANGDNNFGCGGMAGFMIGVAEGLCKGPHAVSLYLDFCDTRMIDQTQTGLDGWLTDEGGAPDNWGPGLVAEVNNILRARVEKVIKEGGYNMYVDEAAGQFCQTEMDAMAADPKAKNVGSYKQFKPGNKPDSGKLVALIQKYTAR